VLKGCYAFVVIVFGSLTLALYNIWSLIDELSLLLEHRTKELTGATDLCKTSNEAMKKD